MAVPAVKAVFLNVDADLIFVVADAERASRAVASHSAAFILAYDGFGRRGGRLHTAINNRLLRGFIRVDSRVAEAVPAARAEWLEVKADLIFVVADAERAFGAGGASRCAAFIDACGTK